MSPTPFFGRDGRECTPVSSTSAPTFNLILLSYSTPPGTPRGVFGTPPPPFLLMFGCESLNARTPRGGWNQSYFLPISHFIPQIVLFFPFTSSQSSPKKLNVSSAVAPFSDFSLSPPLPPEGPLFTISHLYSRNSLLFHPLLLLMSGYFFSSPDNFPKQTPPLTSLASVFTLL